MHTFMDQTEVSRLANQLIVEITFLTQEYNEAIKRGKELSEAKEIREKIKTLAAQLDELINKRLPTNLAR